MKNGVESLGRVRAQGIALLLVTLVVGVLAGVALERVRAIRSLRDLTRSGAGMMRPWVMDGAMPAMYRELELTREQRAQIMEIMERSRPRTEEMLQHMLPRLRSVTDSVRMEIRAVLTPQQAARMDSLMATMRHRRGPMRQGMRGRGMGAPPPPQR